MAGRFPFDSQGHSGNNPLHNAQVRAALGLSQVDEALYLQRQQEIQRDFQIRQMLLAEQIDQQTRLDSMLHEQQLKALGEHLQEFPDLQQHYSRLLLNEQYQRHEERNLFRERQIQQEELRRRAMVQTQQKQTKANSPKASSPKIQTGTLRDIAADSLAGNAMKKSELEKRVFAKPDIECLVGGKKRARSDTNESIDSKQNKKKDKKTLKNDEDSQEETLKPAATDEAEEEDTKISPSSPPAASADSIEDRKAKLSAQDLLGFASTPAKYTPKHPPTIAKMGMAIRVPVPPMAMPPLRPPYPPYGYSFTAGTIAGLLEAGTAVKKTDDAATTLKSIKKHVEWSDSESEREDDLELQRTIARAKGDVINLPGFNSILPQLPQEPEVAVAKAKKKHKGILDDDSVESTPKGKSSKLSRRNSRASENGDKSKSDDSNQDFPYPVDTWWPSATSIRRERKLAGESSEDPMEEDEEVFGKEAPFQGNVEKLRNKLGNEVEPGVLEKVPHCRIHRQLMKKRKNPSAPELVHCFQVTELYPSDVMVCCSHCGTWRHTACGGHHKPYSVREAIDAPFVPVCDRCHEEEKVFRDHPIGRKRLDRQRAEQIRRGLATSAAMRQASFSKHGGTYKWPLGSVSATHIGGHTRSVHSRHDKAEKQWMDMATRLGRGYGYRPKERIKFRTKELERLLVSVEDAEGHMDRHNMMLFLLQDTLRDDPVGFEKRRQNIFDPEEDISSDAFICKPVTSPTKDSNESGDDDVFSVESEDSDKKEKTENIICSRSGCLRKPRFDSLFCSDSCGLSALESDLLRTFQYASDIHPSLLRN